MFFYDPSLPVTESGGMKLEEKWQGLRAEVFPFSMVIWLNFHVCLTTKKSKVEVNP